MDNKFLGLKYKYQKWQNTTDLNLEKNYLKSQKN